MKLGVAIVLASFTVAACGGGGGGGGGAGGGGGGGQTDTATAPSSPPPPAPAPTIPPPQQPPSVEAGVNQTVTEGAVVELLGSAVDPDGTIAFHEWVQVAGPEIALADASSYRIRFDAPRRYMANLVVFRLIARDNDGLESSDDVTVYIEPDYFEIPITRERAYFSRSPMLEPIVFLQFDIDPSVDTRIVLRSFWLDSDIEIYQARNLAPSSLLAASYEEQLANDTVHLEAGSPTPVYVAVLSQTGAQLTVTLDQPSEFLEDGFPVDVVATGGTSSSVSRSVSVANIDADRELEILFSGVARGPLYAVNHDGTTVDGWPWYVDAYTTYPSVGNLAGSADIQEVALGLGPTVASCHPDRYVLDGAGRTLQGWPIASCNAGTTAPPVLFDLDADGIDEVFFRDSIFYADGRPVSGWEGGVSGGPPAIADLSGDGIADFVFSKGVPPAIEALDRSGNMLSGFPIVDLPAEHGAGPIGLPDLDGDGVHEIVRLISPFDGTDRTLVEVYDSDGSRLWETATTSRTPTSLVPAFGDLDNDGRPELLLQTVSEVYAWRGDGTLLPGFPVHYTDPEFPGLGPQSAPLVADVTGDGLPNIVIGDGGSILVYDSVGNLLHRIRVPNGVISAIADVDLDGRNEVAVAANRWNGNDRERFDGIWLFDFGGNQHGPVQWGQHGGSARRQFRYPIDAP